MYKWITISITHVDHMSNIWFPIYNSGKMDFVNLFINKSMINTEKIGAVFLKARYRLDIQEQTQSGVYRC